jgi:hypothetical protein
LRFGDAVVSGLQRAGGGDRPGRKRFDNYNVNDDTEDNLDVNADNESRSAGAHDLCC